MKKTLLILTIIATIAITFFACSEEREHTNPLDSEYWDRDKAPSNLTVVGLSLTTARISWTDNSNEQRFIIERKLSNSTSYEIIGDVQGDKNSGVTKTYTDNSLIAGLSYNYSVYAVFDEATSNMLQSPDYTSNLPAPTNLTSTILDETSIKLDWTDNSSDENGFIIDRKIGLEGTWITNYATVGENIKTWTDTGLMSGTIYYYKVKAYYSTYYSAYSNEISSGYLIEYYWIDVNDTFWTKINIEKNQTIKFQIKKDFSNLTKDGNEVFVFFDDMTINTNWQGKDGGSLICSNGIGSVISDYSASIYTVKDVLPDYPFEIYCYLNIQGSDGNDTTIYPSDNTGTGDNIRVWIGDNDVFQLSNFNGVNIKGTVHAQSTYQNLKFKITNDSVESLYYNETLSNTNSSISSLKRIGIGQCDGGSETLIDYIFVRKIYEDDLDINVVELADYYDVSIVNNNNYSFNDYQVNIQGIISK